MSDEQMIRQTQYGYMDFSDMVYAFNKIQWKDSVNKIIKFQYKDINAYLVINKCCEDNFRVNITIPGYIENYDMLKSQILYGQLGGVLGKKSPNYLYKIGEVVNQLLILDAYKTVNKKYKVYKYRCTIDGYEGHITEDQLKRGQGCSLCANKVVVRGINDIGTTAIDIASLLFDENDRYKYTAHSDRKVYFLCPHCGEKIYTRINDVARRGLKCRRCGDGVSYPNKFMYNFVKQALCVSNKCVDFNTETRFPWSKNVQHKNQLLSGDKIYDIVIPLEHTIIIENHGAQHFYRQFSKQGRTLEDEIENDALKRNLAIRNGILPSHYIEIDCSVSSADFIKQSIINSGLLELLGINESQIDWQECNRFANSSRVFEACELWNGGVRSTQQIANKMKMDRNTILKYIRCGEELGIITDPPKHKKPNSTIQN